MAPAIPNIAMKYGVIMSHQISILNLWMLILISMRRNNQHGDFDDDILYFLPLIRTWSVICWTFIRDVRSFVGVFWSQ
jgi:hypothetical protein